MTAFGRISWLLALALGFLVGQEHAWVSGVQARECALSGLVLDSKTREPVVGAVVQLLAQSSGAQRLQRTDELGRFVFANLTPGAYRASAVKPGYQDGRLNATVGGSLGRVVLVPGEWLRDVHIEMKRLSSLSGRVVDEGGAPVVGAYVRVFRSFMLAGSSRLAAGPVARTDTEGSYRFSNLTEGTYIVSVPSVQQDVSPELAQESQAPAPPGTPVGQSGSMLLTADGSLLVGAYPTAPIVVDGRPGAYAPLFYPSGGTLAAASAIAIETGEHRQGIDMTLRPVATAKVCGHIEPRGEDLSGYVVRLVLSGLELMGSGSETATAPVKSNGTFCFQRVPTGEYVLLTPGGTFEFMFAAQSVDRLLRTELPQTPGVSRSGAIANGVPVPAAPDIQFSTHLSDSIKNPIAGRGRLPLAVGEEDILDVVLPLRPSGAISGHIDYRDLPGEPPGGSIEVAACDGDPATGVRYARVSAKSAQFAATVLAPGDYCLRLGSADLTIVSIVADGVDVTRTPIRVEEGKTSTIALTLSARQSTIAGVVSAQEGAPTQSIVVAFPTDRRLWTNYGFTPTWIRTVTTVNGRYELSRVRPGEYFVAAFDLGDGLAWSRPDLLLRASTSAARVSIALGDSKRLDLSVSKQ